MRLVGNVDFCRVFSSMVLIGEPTVVIIVIYRDSSNFIYLYQFKSMRRKYKNISCVQYLPCGTVRVSVFIDNVMQ